MKVYGQLEKAQLEQLSSAPSPGTVGQVYFDTTKRLPYYIDVNGEQSFSQAREPSRNFASAASITTLTSDRSYVRLTGSTATSLHGISAGLLDNQRLLLVNFTGSNLTIKHESGSATAANRITTMTGTDIATTGNGAAEFVYDTTTARWICLWVSA